jgi:hypothetical protein
MAGTVPTCFNAGSQQPDSVKVARPGTTEAGPRGWAGISSVSPQLVAVLDTLHMTAAGWRLNPPEPFRRVGWRNRVRLALARLTQQLAEG